MHLLDAIHNFFLIDYKNLIRTNAILLSIYKKAYLYVIIINYKDILDTALTELDKLQVRPNNGMPPTLAQKGHQFLYPSHNVMAVRQRKKNIYACSICKSVHHTKKNVLLKKKNNMYIE